jgi:hypothetical protein
VTGLSATDAWNEAAVAGDENLAEDTLISGPTNYFCSPRMRDFSPSIHSICSASRSQRVATSSNSLLMDGFFAFAALCLAWAAFCRHMSARHDIRSEHLK